MDGATAHVREVARRVVAVALELGPLRAALLAGSGARGDADEYSDVDLLLYVDDAPPEGRLDALREAVGGDYALPIAPGLLQFEVGGVTVQTGYTTVAEQEADLDRLLVRLEDVHGPEQKLLSGLVEGLPLHGDDLLGQWRARAAAYPDALRRSAIEHHWRFFPLWYFDEVIERRDAELWRLDMLLEASFDLLGVLAGLNRVYYARFELKRLRALAAKLELSPPDLADRLESLFRLPPEQASAELGRLVVETRELVARELPDLELPLRRPPGTRARPWSLDVGE
jgi:hypothetical protein